MKRTYESPDMQAILPAIADIITVSLDSAEDGFDGDIIDLSPVG